MTIASIDLGSNSVILLISKLDLHSRKIFETKDYFFTPRISENLTATGRISENSTQRLLKVLHEFSARIKDAECDHVIMTATNAFRIAENAETIKNLVESNFGWQITIVTGEEEARISFLGAILPEFEFRNLLLIDIGGSSTEIISGNVEKIIQRTSLQLGVVSLKELFFNNSKAADHVSENLARNHIKDVLSKVVPGDINKYDCALAVAGTPTTISAIVNKVKIYTDELINNTVITKEQIRKTGDRIKRLTKDEMILHYGEMVKGREDLIYGGCLILEEFMNYFSLGEIVVSTKGLRYGAFYDYLIKNNYYTIKKM